MEATTEPSPHGKSIGPLAVGTVLNDRYRLAQHLGAGASSWVYRAEDVVDPTSPPLAIKEFLDDPFGTGADKREAVRWFRREVSTLLRFDHPSIPKVHPSIPKVHAHWTETAKSGPFYLAMDFISGKTRSLSRCHGTRRRPRGDVGHVHSARCSGDAAVTLWVHRR